MGRILTVLVVLAIGYFIGAKYPGLLARIGLG